MGTTPNQKRANLSKGTGTGYTRAQLAAWGIAWPPPKGWKKQLPESLSQPQPVFPVSAGPSPDLAKWVLDRWQQARPPRYIANRVTPPLK